MKLPNQTENAALAIALHLAGVRPYEFVDEYGQTQTGFAMVIYDRKTLDNLGCKTIAEALSRDLPGQRSFSFSLEDAELQEALAKVWDEEREKIKNNEASEVDVSPADVVRIVARVLHCRKQIVKDWKDLPIYAYFETGPPEIEEGEDETRIIVSPGFKMVNVRASQKIIDRLELEEGAIIGRPQ